MANFSDLIGKKIVGVSTDLTDNIKIQCSDGTEYDMYHSQDCCENVQIDEINGDLTSLVGQVILHAEESTNSDIPKHSVYEESFTWTFYHIRTVLSTITIKWYGTSNGYYSEAVSFVETRSEN
jgi:hypothetical protein